MLGSSKVILRLISNTYWYETLTIQRTEVKVRNLPSSKTSKTLILNYILLSVFINIMVTTTNMVKKWGAS